MDNRQRFAHAAAVAEHYSCFRDFAEDGMAFLGFPLTDMQGDISEYMSDGPRLRMVMAQRGEAKSTLAALLAVWRLIQRPSCRVLVVSGGEAQASEVATLIIRLITSWDILEYLRPDRNAGDRSSVEAFDVHYALKGLDKSPSVACIGITANLQGKRADLLIADDVETTKNGLTVVQRSQLLVLTKDFSSICTHGDILYLGTPQTKDSIYNTLPGRGFDVRIWPGRFPTQEEVEKYGSRLAPFLSERIKADPTLQTGGGLDGSKGKPADPHRYNEQALCDKELDQGPEGFQLQYMLDTSLSDAARQQLRLIDLIVANFDHERLPEIIVYQAAPKYLVEMPADFPIPMTKLYHPVAVDCQFAIPKEGAMMFVDPAGGGSDELGAAVSNALGPYIHVFDVVGLKGGLTDANGAKLVDLICKYKVKVVKCESNMGHGLFEITLRSIIATALKDAEEKKDTERIAALKAVGVIGEYSTGQKERRIIDSIVSPLQRHRIVIHRQVFDSDRECGKQHTPEKRQAYSVFYQFSNITTDRGSLTHDDRLEAMAGAIRHWKGVLVTDEHKAAEARALGAAREFVHNPMGYKDQKFKAPKGIKRNIYTRR
jgi:hypothetical protein